MKISELPTPRLRARAMEIAKLYNDEYEDFEIHEAFVWSDTEEKHAFWSFCEDGNWDKAKELQPDLFKPMDGKPHIKLRQRRLPHGICWSLDYATEGRADLVRAWAEKSWRYILEVSPSWEDTIQEAVDALYSFKRATDVAGEVV